MQQIEISDLSWPKKYRMEELREILPEKYLSELILYFSSMTKKERTLEFPNNHVLKKLICHYYGKRVASGAYDWDKVMAELRKGSKTLKQLDISRKEVRRLYLQRAKEIMRERE